MVLMTTNARLIEKVREKNPDLAGCERYERVLEGLAEIDRLDFFDVDDIDDHERNLIYSDFALEIGHNQSCSQPSLVARMAYILQLEPGMTVYEVGTGSGYSAVLTAKLISGGTLVTVERIGNLAKFGARNIEHYIKEQNIDTNVIVIKGNGKKVLKDEAPYDRIYLTAGVSHKYNTSRFRKHLTDDGLLLYPHQAGPLRLENKAGEVVSDHGTVYFVPLL